MSKLISKLKTEKVVLACILILAATLRFYGLNWDQGYHLHPDERWLTMVVGQISWPKDLNEFLSVESPLNPKFFAYGSLPIYLLRFAGNLVGLASPQFAHYSDLNLLGRMISAFFDLGTVFFVFLLGRKIWNEKVGLLAAFFYGISVFPIQNAHFYTVDTQLTFWVMLTIWLIIEKRLMPVGIAFGAALATKITAVFLLLPIFLGIKLIGPIKPLRKLICCLTFVLGATLLTFAILQPYAFIDLPRFKSDVLLQSQMSRDATVFPYTIQYVGTTPYIYQLKNLVLWGLGAPLGILGILGVLWLTIRNLRSLYKSNNQQSTINNQQLLLLSFFWIYFIFIGASAVKFMRYLLPLYPLLTLAAASLVAPPRKNPSGFSFLTRRVGELAARVFATGSIIWALSFMQIYTRPHTRVVATEWINQNISNNASLATEHWDDELPLWGGENFKRVKLNLYDSDNAAKVDELIQKIVQADYIILSSNRLYDSIPKLPDRYPTTIRYYELLFSEKLGFAKVAEFTSYPNFSLFPSARLGAGIFHFSLNDSSADESFHVYDHPKAMIFKKTERLDIRTLQKLLTEN